MDTRKIDDIIDMADRATASPMPKADALEFLEQLIANLETRCEALKEEMKEEE